MTKRRPDLQATTRWICKRLRNPNKKSWSQLVKTVRYIKGSRDLATFMPKAGKPDIIEAFSMETGLAMIWTGGQHLVVI